MKPVSSEFIIETWQRQCELGREASNTLAQQFMKEQPAVGIFLTVCDEQLGAEAERSQLIPLATTVWETMTRVRGHRLKTVRPKVIERADQVNMRMLEKLDEGSEFEWRDSVMGLFKNYNQQPLLAFCIEILMAGHEDAPDLAPDRIGMELFWLKTVIDCFDQ